MFGLFAPKQELIDQAADQGKTRINYRWGTAFIYDRGKRFAYFAWKGWLMSILIFILLLLVLRK